MASYQISVTVPDNKNRYHRCNGHNALPGAAQAMARKGYLVAQIMQQGTW